MFSMIDRSAMDVLCFALNPEDSGAGWERSGWGEDGGEGPHRRWRARAGRHCDLVDVSAAGHAEAALEINARRVHVLLNIMGYTQVNAPPPFVLSGHAASLTPY